jgi:O-antigen ligase
MSLNDPAVLIAVIIGAMLAIAGLFRPFLGLLVLMTVHFIQPGELVPALDALRIELVYAILLLIIVLAQKATVLAALIKTDRVVRGVLMLEAIAIVGIPFSVYPGGTFGAVQTIAKLMILQLLMTVFIDSQDRVKAIMWLLVGFAMWFAGSSFSAYLHGESYFVGGVQRAEGVNSIAGGPNELAGLLLALLPFLIALIRCTKSIVIKISLLACGGLVLFVLGLTGARISMVALLAMALVYVLRSKHKVLNLAICAVVLLILWSSLPSEYQRRYRTVESYAEGGQLDASNELRLQIWQAGWRMFLDHPILGVGAGQFSTAYGTIYSGRAHGAWMQPHNLFLQVLCELGLAGLAVVIYFFREIWIAIRDVLRLRDSAEVKISYEFAFACSFMMFGVGLISLVSHTLFRPYWYLLAGMVAANRAVAFKIVTPEVAMASDVAETKWPVANKRPAPVVRQEGFGISRPVPKR